MIVGRLMREGSTRAAGLLRVALALIVWVRYGSGMTPWHDPAPERVVLGAVFFVTSSMMLVGWWSRAATAVTGLTTLAAFGLGARGDEPSWFHHHTFLLTVAVLLLAMAPCGRSFSVDRWRSGAEERGPLWALDLIGLQVSIVYAWGAAIKMDHAFLSGYRLDVIVAYQYTGALPVGLPQWVLVAAAVAVTGLELLLAVGLWARWSRRWLLPAGLVLHATIYWLLPVSTFTVTMMALYLVFVDPEAVARVVDRLVGDRGEGLDRAG
jgi:hypothetical protein